MRISDPGNRFAARRAANPGAQGFTLIELMVVLAVVAIATVGVSFALRDSRQTALEREGQRLVALLEAGRAISRLSGLPVQWVTTPLGFAFSGPNTAELPHDWLSADTHARLDDGASSATGTSLSLGPEPIIAAQSLTLAQGDRSLRIATDGLHPFEVIPNGDANP